MLILLLPPTPRTIEHVQTRGPTAGTAERRGPTNITTASDTTSTLSGTISSPHADDTDLERRGELVRRRACRRPSRRTPGRAGGRRRRVWRWSAAVVAGRRAGARPPRAGRGDESLGGEVHAESRSDRHDEPFEGAELCHVPGGWVASTEIGTAPVVAPCAVGGGEVEGRFADHVLGGQRRSARQAV